VIRDPAQVRRHGWSMPPSSGPLSISLVLAAVSDTRSGEAPPAIQPYQPAKSRPTFHIRTAPPHRTPLICTPSLFVSSYPAFTSLHLSIHLVLTLNPCLFTPPPHAVMADHPASEEPPAKKHERNHLVLHSVPNAGPRSPPDKPSLRTSSSPHMGHRQSFAENLRGVPQSPRAHRKPSLSQQALQDLLNNPPTKNGAPEFVGREWRTIHVGEIVHSEQVRFVEYDTSVEEATKVS
jgi:hypothetical protein